MDEALQPTMPGLPTPRSPVSCETTVRPVSRSVNRIGSKDSIALVIGERSTQLAVAGDVWSFQVMNSVLSGLPVTVVSVFVLTPIEGSPVPEANDTIAAGGGNTP